MGTRAAEFPHEPLQVVAYHEPNDLLTFYLSDIAGADMKFTFTNVIASFAKIWIPFVIANPGDAHTGQAREKDLMDFLAFGGGLRVGDERG